ncbi:hypothetical protein [Ancylobacter sp. IITR112]|uniref:hypothetical protein n=1 Tax=Ancylobacter sp. IITR112 TaxID=3138073 RepID=UPI003529F7B0
MKLIATPGFRASYDPPTGLLIIDGPGFSGIGTLEEWEAIERAIRSARHRARMDAYEGKWPAPPAGPEV